MWYLCSYKPASLVIGHAEVQARESRATNSPYTFDNLQGSFLSVASYVSMTTLLSVETHPEETSPQHYRSTGASLRAIEIRCCAPEGHHDSALPLSISARVY